MLNTAAAVMVVIVAVAVAVAIDVSKLFLLAAMPSFMLTNLLYHQC